MGDIVYTCIGKGGKYSIVCNCKGAGTVKAQEFVVYQDLVSKEIYVRELSDFRARMEIVVNDVVY